jgi:threonine/homoserine/homoserine lactone efflux protein
MDFMGTQFLTFITVALILTITPGVDTFIVMRNVLRGSHKDGYFTALGICSGLFAYATFLRWAFR